MDMLASPQTKEAVGLLRGMGINPMKKAARPPTREEIAATNEQIELRKRTRESEQAEHDAANELAESEPIPTDPGSAWQIVGKAAAARTQRTVRTTKSIKKARADEAAMPTPAAPAETARSSKKSDKSRQTDGSDSGHRIKRRITGTKLSKAKVPKQTPIIEEDPTEHDSDRESALSESNTNTSLTTKEEPKVIASHPMNPPAAAHKPRANGMTIAHEKIKQTLSPMHRVYGQSAKRICSL